MTAEYFMTGIGSHQRTWPLSPSSNLKPVAPLVVLGAMLPIVERGQSVDSTLT